MSRTADPLDKEVRRINRLIMREEVRRVINLIEAGASTEEIAAVVATYRQQAQQRDAWGGSRRVRALRAARTAVPV